MSYFILILLGSSIILVNADYSSMQIKDLKMSQCDKKMYPVVVNNVSIQLGSKVKISGSMSSQVDLVGPIEASTYLKRYFWPFWVLVPCEDNLGSCRYSDLCKYGLAPNKPCPQNFQDDNVPCRCPIQKGNYTLAPSEFDVTQTGSILSGAYKGSVTLTQAGKVLSCYSVSFTLYDNSENSVIQV